MAFLSKENLLAILSDFKTKVSAKIVEATPTKLSQLVNDAGYATGTEVTQKATDALNQAKTYADTAFGNVDAFKIVKVESLPEATEAVENTIYLVAIPGSDEENNIYNEYIVIDDTWEHLGTTEVDLSGYDNKSSVNAKIEAAKPVEMTSEEIQAFNTSLWA